jgi:hypothetical protein
MPRKRMRPSPDGRANNGGVRQGTPGTPYPNRSDLRQAPKAATGQEYGKAGAQIAAQRAVPIPAAPPAQGGPTPPGGGAAGPMGPGPGDLPFNRPTERPGEPLTTGIPSGPGAGPEALVATNRPDPEMEALRPYLPTLELLASQPNASPTARMFVRRLRGSMPPPQG